MSIPYHDAKRFGQTLDQLEGVTSGVSLPGDTSLVKNCLRLRKVPIGEFTVENLRLIIGQREGLTFLVPLALGHIAADPLAGGDYFPGDLLCVILRAGAEFWRRHPYLRDEIERVVDELPEIPELIADALAEFRRD